MSRRRASKRKRRFIDEKQQLRFAIEITLYALLFPLIFLIVAIGDHVATWLIGANVESVHPLLRGLLGFFISYWWAVLLSLGIVAYISIWFSHKVFGPVYRFEDALRQKKKNPAEPASCRVRRKDYFHEFSKLLEEYLNEFQGVEGAGPIMEKGDTEADEASLTDSNPT